MADEDDPSGPEDPPVQPSRGESGAPTDRSDGAPVERGESATPEEQHRSAESPNSSSSAEDNGSPSEDATLGSAPAPESSLDGDPVRGAGAYDAKPPAPAPLAPPLLLKESNASLPPNYFRAAGDPDEPPEEPDNSLPARAHRSFAQKWVQFRAFAEPRYVAFIGGARTFWRDLLLRLRGVRHPRSVREAAVWTGWLAAGFVTLVVGFFFFVTWGMPSTDDLWQARGSQSITFLDRNGHVILREGAQNAPPVDLASLPPYVPQAFVAIEDRRFYQHFGVDLGGMMRAGAENMRAGHVVQGGSTITQQLAKNLFLSNERSWRRKLQEVAMAIWLETKFTKNEILALYLSRVYFGAGAYGIEAAAERYFDRPAHDLTLLQSAMLAGLVKAPSRMNPASQDMRAARARADTVLQEMVNLGYITQAQRQAALQEDLVVSRRNPAGVLSYYRDWIDPELNRIIGTTRDDFIVETTIDISAQRAANDAVNSVLNEQGQVRHVGEAGLLAMDDTGGIRAMIGGRDYEITQFNRTTQAHRQPGSSFKFFIYLAAMENGLTPWSVREDAPVVVHIAGQPDYIPGNYGDRFHGAVTLTEALQNSYNMVALRLTQEIGGQRVIDVARRLGVQSPLHNYPSLGLGAQEVTLLELVRGYATMANSGYNVEPHGITRIRRATTDEVMWSWRPQRREQLIADRPRRLMDYMMNRVVEAGTGTHARMPGRQIAGKTGTANDYRDAWFVGFTPGYVAGVWAGNDNHTIMDHVTGGSIPADIWQRFMQVALRNEPARPLDMPSASDFNSGVPEPEVQAVTAVGAPLGALTSGPPASQGPQDTTDHSLDVGPQG
ncbi:MAG: PBP1A family penicillin-binding protein [Proteobacteria bacterium]|nr:PBP1A family penicillin-binding protein [Pseudomonadota bacterium]